MSRILKKKKCFVFLYVYKYAVNFSITFSQHYSRITSHGVIFLAAKFHIADKSKKMHVQGKWAHLRR